MKECCLTIFLRSLPLEAAPAIGAVRAIPTTSVIGTPTQITVAASISHPTLIAGRVELLQLNSNRTITILGKFHDASLDTNRPINPFPSGIWEIGSQLRFTKESDRSQMVTQTEAD